jgi:hypothetical protein
VDRRAKKKRVAQQGILLGSRIDPAEFRKLSCSRSERENFRIYSEAGLFDVFNDCHDARPSSARIFNLYRKTNYFKSKIRQFF